MTVTDSYIFLISFFPTSTNFSVREMKPVNNAALKRCGSAAKGSPSTATSSARKQKVNSSNAGTKARGEDLPLCGVCAERVSDEVRALQCDACDRAWRCIDCLGITAEGYDILSGVECLKWFCESCEAKNDKTSEKRFEQLMDLMNKLIDNFKSVEDRLSKKAESTELACIDRKLAVLESRVDRLEQECSTGNKKADDSAATLKAMVDRLEQECDRLAQECSSGSKKADDSAAALKAMDQKISDLAMKLEQGRTAAEPREAGVVREVTEQTVVKHLLEEKAVEARKNNIVLFRVPESEEPEPQARQDEDKRFVEVMCTEALGIKLHDDSIVKLFRLGKKTENSTLGRPLLVSFKEQQIKEEVLSNVRLLKGSESKYRTVGVAQDLTPQQRDEAKKLKEEATRQLVSLGEQPENYKIFVSHRGATPKLIKFKKS